MVISDQRGFSLADLFVCLTLFGLLTGYAIPSFSRLLQCRVLLREAVWKSWGLRIRSEGRTVSGKRINPRVKTRADQK